MCTRHWLLPPVAALLGVGWVGVADADWPPAPGATAAELADAANWPNDPDYGYVASSDAAERRDGQWQLYSFVPEQSLTERLIRSGETAAGSSVDRAWRLTTGNGRVLIAVVDSGIRWDEVDLADQVRLSVGELGHVPPVRSDGTPCAPLDEARPTEARFDCNADGSFSVSDYAGDPRLLPEATEEPCGEEMCTYPTGDANHNGVFDAGDLLRQSFIVDGVDDDVNGFVDDIVGWDFVDHDNDPFDGYAPTGTSHGTERALDAAAATNNAAGRAGVCPRCRVLPLRVSDGYVADSVPIAHATIYAVDSGSTVVLMAQSALSMSSFARTAVAYAWHNGTLVVASLGDLGSRAHAVPATDPHVLPVHAVTMAGASPESTTTTSFLSGSPCGNYGAQTLLSAPSATGSREAAAHAAGVAGLVQAAALGRGGSDGGTALAAAEVLQLLLATADDVDLPESREDGSMLFWSQPGFDQNFGHGRINANRAVTWAAEGRIPPVIDLVAPEWFEPLYADRITAPVPIRGTISARRAESYDYWVDWAPGVQPLEGAFTTVAQQRNVDASQVTGAGTTPLAELEIRSLSTEHERDADSQLGENDRTITVRLRAVAHYGGEIGDVAAERRRAVTIQEDPDLLDGFPVRLPGSGESSPKLADIDGDGVRDIVVATSDGAVHVYRAVGDRPAAVDGFPVSVRHADGLDDTAEQELRCDSGTEPDDACFDYRGAPAYTRTEGVDVDLARETILATPAIADLTGDGQLEIVIATVAGSLYVLDHEGTVLPGWPRRLPDVPTCPSGREITTAPCRGEGQRIERGALASPVLADLDGDGRLDIIQAGLDGRVHVYSVDGASANAWPVTISAPEETELAPARLVGTPAVADFDGDGVPDLALGSNQKLGAAGFWGSYYLVDGRGRRTDAAPYLAHWPITVTSFALMPMLAEGAPGSVAAADFDGDGRADAVLHGNASDPLILPADPGLQNPPGAIPTLALPEREDPETGQISRGLEPTRRHGADSAATGIETMVPLFADPAVGDLNQDGVPDLVTTGTSLDVAQSLAACAPAETRHAHLLGMWDGRTGGMLPGSPVPIEDVAPGSSPAIADVSGDGYPEVIAGSAGPLVHAVDACGDEPEGWPKVTGQWLGSAPAVGDVDGDQMLDVVVVTREGWLFAWRTEGPSDGVVAWESFHHDNRNTGNLSVPLDQGRLLGDAGPLPVDELGHCAVGDDEVAPPDTSEDYAPGGGCGCTTTPQPSPLPWLTLVILPGLVARRRRRPGGVGAEGRT